MARLGRRTGRRYHLVEYFGHPEAERVLVLMGSGAETAKETAAHLAGRGERVGVLQIRLYRPFPAEALLQALPKTARRIAVLDRTKEPGSSGEPLFLDVVTTLAESHADGQLSVMPVRDRRPLRPVVQGIHAGHGRRRAGGTDPRPASAPLHRRHHRRRLRHEHRVRPVDGYRCPRYGTRGLFGLGSDGTVGANKNTIKILGSDENVHAQGYFVYDSKKSGSQTVSHLRFGPRPIRAPYLIRQASFVGCHHFGLLERVDVLGHAAPGATLLLDCPLPADKVWEALSRPVQEQILAKGVHVYTIDAGRVAREAGLPGGPTPSCRPASSPFPACCHVTKRSRGSRPPSSRRTASAEPTSSNGTKQRSTPRWLPCIQSLFRVG